MAERALYQSPRGLEKAELSRALMFRRLGLNLGLLKLASVELGLQLLVTFWAGLEKP